MRRLIIALAVLVGLLVVADFAAAAVFEHEVSKRARTHFGLADDPSVRVGGFSFLLQAVSGEYEHVSVDAKGVPVRDTLRDVEVHADLRGVTAPLGELLSGSASGVQVREVEGQVRVKTSDVNRAISQNPNETVRTLTRVTIDPVSLKTATTEPSGDTGQEATDPPDPEGTTAGTRICGTLDLASPTDLCVFGIISLVGEKISFSPKRLEIRNEFTSGPLSRQVQSQLLELFGFTVDPGLLPFTVTPTAVKVESGSLSLKGKARDLALTGSSG